MRRLVLLPAFLFAVPALSAPNFPLTFDGETCDNAGCVATRTTVQADGTLVEEMSGITGTYTWDPVTKTYRANYMDFVGTSFVGTKDDGAPCARGTWTNTIGQSGTFWMCKI